MAEFVRRWAKPAATAIVVGTLFWWITGLIGLHTRLAVDLLLALLIAAASVLADRSGPRWTVAMPGAPDTRTRAVTTQDARLFFLRRTLQDATSPESRADTGRASPTGVQRSLRAVAAHRVGQRLGRPIDPEDTTELAAQLDPALSDYLCTTPPPPVDESRLTDLIRRIEDL